MKKIILFLAFLACGFLTFSQSGVPEPTHTLIPSKFKPGNWNMLGAWDSTNACYADTLGYYMEGDTVKIWSNKILWINGNTIRPNLWKLTTNKLEPVISTNYINTDSAYYVKNRVILKANGTNLSLGYLAGDSISNESVSIGYGSGYKNSGNNFSGIGTASGYMNTGDFFSGIGSNVGKDNTGDSFSGIGANAGDGNTGDTCIFIGTYSGYNNSLSNVLFIGQGDSNAAIIYGEMLTRPRIRINGELNVETTITNGGLINRDTVATIADSITPFAFPTSSTGWAEIYIDSLGYIVSFANAYWSIDGTVTLINNGTNVVTTNTDDKHCIFDEGAYCALINRRASSYKYMIKFHYHN